MGMGAALSTEPTAETRFGITPAPPPAPDPAEAAPGDEDPALVSARQNGALLAEGYRRGILNDQQKALYLEAAKRGLAPGVDIGYGEAAKRGAANALADLGSFVELPRIALGDVVDTLRQHLAGHAAMTDPATLAALANPSAPRPAVPVISDPRAEAAAEAATHTGPNPNAITPYAQNALGELQDIQQFKDEQGGTQPGEAPSLGKRVLQGGIEAIPQLATAIASGGAAVPEELAGDLAGMGVAAPYVLRSLGAGLSMGVPGASEQAITAVHHGAAADPALLKQAIKNALITTALSGLPMGVPGSRLVRTLGGAAIGGGGAAAADLAEQGKVDPADVILQSLFGGAIAGLHPDHTVLEADQEPPPGEAAAPVLPAPKPEGPGATPAETPPPEPVQAAGKALYPSMEPGARPSLGEHFNAPNAVEQSDVPRGTMGGSLQDAELQAFPDPRQAASADFQARAQAAGIPAEAAAKVAPAPLVDPVTGLYDARAAEEGKPDARTMTVQNALAWAERTRQPAWYVEGDSANQGGLNAFKGHTAANDDIRAVADRFKQALEATGGRVIPFRHGGDEISAVVVGVPEAKMHEAINAAATNIRGYTDEKGLSEIPNPKYPNRPGYGLHMAFAPITPGRTPKEIYQDADLQIESAKVNHDVERQKAVQPQPPADRYAPAEEAAGRPPVEGEAAQGGAEPQPRGIEPVQTGAPAAQADTAPAHVTPSDRRFSRRAPQRAEPTVSYVKSLRTASWGDFKHKLARDGVIASPTADVPREYQRAFIKTFRPGDLARFDRETAKRDTSEPRYSKREANPRRRFETYDWERGNVNARTPYRKEPFDPRTMMELQTRLGEIRAEAEKQPDYPADEHLRDRYLRDHYPEAKKLLDSIDEYESPQPTEPFYSQMERSVTAKLQGSGTPEQISKQLQALAKNGQFKQEELEWSGVQDWLKELGDRRVTKQEVLDYLRESNLTIQEIPFTGEGGDFDPDEFEDAITDRADTAYQEAISERADELRRDAEMEMEEPYGYDTEPDEEDGKTVYRAYITGEGLGRRGMQELDDSPFETQKEAEQAASDEADRMNEDYKNDTLENENWEERAERDLDYGDFRDRAEQEIREENPQSESGVHFGDPNWQLPGGEDYTELLFTVPKRKVPSRFVIEAHAPDHNGNTFAVVKHGYTLHSFRTRAEAEEYVKDRENLGDREERPVIKGAGEVSGHFGEYVPTGAPVIAHVRYKLRENEEGKTVLAVEEVQSDWHQQGREKGYLRQRTEAETKELHDLSGQIRELDAQLKELLKRLQPEDAGDELDAKIEAAETELENARKEYADARNAAEQTIVRLGNLGFDSFHQANTAIGQNDDYAQRWDVPAADRPALDRLHDAYKKFQVINENLDNLRMEKHSRVGPNAFVKEAERWGDRDQGTFDENVPFAKDMTPADRGLVRRYAEAVARKNELEQVGRQGVANAPFKTTWPMLVMKRMIRYAAEHGYAGVAWTTGAQQADRYGLHKYVDEGRIAAVGNGKYDVELRKGDDVRHAEQSITSERLADLIGKADAKKMIAKADYLHGAQARYDFGDKKNIDERSRGMKSFYDQIYPQEIQKYIKKWGGKVTLEKISGEDFRPRRGEGEPEEGKHFHTMHYVGITPRMKGAVLLEGQPLFRLPPKPLEPTGNTVENVRKQADLAALEKHGLLRIRQKPDAEDPADIGGKYHNGVMDLYADNIYPGEEKAVAIHEGAHFVLRHVPGMDKLLAEYQRLLDAKDPDALRGAGRVPPETPDDIRQEEGLAYSLEEFVKNKGKGFGGKFRDLLQRIVNAIRAWFHETAFYKAMAAKGVKMDLSVGDIAALVRYRLRRVAKGHEPINADAAFSKRKAPTVEPKGAKQTETPEFKKWFGKSKVIDRNKQPLVVYHGTTNDFSKFAKDKGGTDSDFGRGFYFTNNTRDVSTNYAGMGPDLTAKVERHAEDIFRQMHEGGEEPGYGTPEYKAAMAKAKQQAKAKLTEHQGAVMPVYLKMENPAVFGSPKEFGAPDETVLTAYYGRGDKITGSINKLLRGIDGAAREFNAREKVNSVTGISDEAVRELKGDLLTEALDNGNELTIAQARDVFANSKGVKYLDDSEGNLADREFFRSILEHAGFDGIIDNTVDDKFGTGRARRGGTGMVGMNPQTVHYIAFKPTQIKSATGNRGSFNPRSPDVRYSKREKPPTAEERINRDDENAKQSPLIAKAKELADVFQSGMHEVGEDVKMFTSPIAAGAKEGAALAKDYANAKRAALYELKHVTDHIIKNFTREQRTRMYDALAAESLAATRGTKAEGGFETLTPTERALVDQLRAKSDAVADEAQRVGMLRNRMQIHDPRVLARVLPTGEYERLRGDKGPGLGGLGRGFKTTTPNLKARKHETGEETESAARAKFGEDVELMRDIIVVPHVTAALEQAVAGRKLINAVKAFGDDYGAETVTEDARPQYFTIDHPAFKFWRPKFIERPADEFGENMRVVPLRDEDGNVVWEQKSLYVHPNLKGPLMAVLDDTRPNIVVRGLMQLKTMAMSTIIGLFPPVHRSVIFFKTLPYMPLRMLTFSVQRMGRDIMLDPKRVREAILDGVDPVDIRGWYGDVHDQAQPVAPEPGRSVTAKVAGLAARPLGKEAATATKQFVDDLGEFWHGTLMWHKVARTQYGLWHYVKTDLIKRGMDPKAAGRVAAHMANRYAGAIPREDTGRIARQTLNFMYFSRTFTGTNVGIYKDALIGLPRAVQEQVRRDAGETQRQTANSYVKKAQVRALVKDIAFYYITIAALQAAFTALRGDKQQSTLAERFQRTVKDVEKTPSEALNVFNMVERMTPNYDNEPGKQDRILVGYTKDGTGIYLKTPMGKIGEDLIDFISSPLDVNKRKESTIFGAAMNILNNDKGYGKQIYDPNSKGIAGAADNVARVGAYFYGRQIPSQLLENATDLATGKDRTPANVAAVGGTPLGLFFSRGYPGGPAAGEQAKVRQETEFRWQEIQPQVSRDLRQGNVSDALKAMQGARLPIGEILGHLRAGLMPGAKVSPGSLKTFYQSATPEEAEAMQRFLNERH